VSDATAADIVDLALRAKPELIVHRGSLPDTAETVRDLLSASGRLFDRGLPIRVVRPADGGPPSAIPLTRHNVVMETHRLCQPMQKDSRGNLIPVTLPDRVAQMYLDMVGDWRLSPLAGISTAPLLSADGSVRTADGYDPDTGLWCRSVPTLSLPPAPSRTDAEEALRRLRQSFRTFPFADASRRWDFSLGVEVVDLSLPPGRDESAFLVDLQTAVCRSSLPLAPGAFSQRQKYQVRAAERGCWSVRLP
jgi:putative DNA primase/helicase